MLPYFYGMKKFRSGLSLKKSIIKSLKDNEFSLRKLETKVNTNNETIIMHCKELEFLGIIKFNKHKKNPKNGRPYTTVSLTDYGKKLKI